MGSKGSHDSIEGTYAILCLSHMLMHVFTQMHIGLIPILRVELGLDTLAIGFMASIPLLIQAVLTIPGGLLADRINPSRLIPVGLFISGIGGIMMMWVNSVTLLILFVSLFSISSALIHPAALSVVSNLVSTKARGKALGFFGSAGTLGIALGPISLSFLVNAFGWRLVYLMWSIPLLLVPTVILKLKLKKTSGIEEKTVRRESTSSEFHILRNLTLILILAIMGVRSIGGNAINTYITPYFVDGLRIGSELAIFIFGLNPLMGIFASSTGGVMVDRIGERRWLAISSISQIVFLLVAAFTAYLPFVIVGYLCYSFFGYMEMPAEQLMIVKLTPKGGRGLAYSLSFLPSTIVGSFSPILVALIVEAFGIWQIFPFAIAMFALAITILGSIWKRIK
ncbi:MFS transporter [Candidatus Bathyarchaeota archaeon]|nr:MFS transporter [Candidatus Bathyarchaeota archaeon]